MTRLSTFLAGLLALLFMMPVSALAVRKEKRSVVHLETSLGDIRIALSDMTPVHRDNFLRLAASGYYDGLLFHRVIESFVIQGGDPDSRNANKDSLLGEGGQDYTLPAEIVFPDLYHVRGAVAAAREGDDVNPDFRSSGSQFYIVWGRKMAPADLKKAISYLSERGIELDRFMISDYQMYGGTPHLDGAYTVFGEVIEGLDIVGKIQKCPTDTNDRPLEDVVIIRASVERLSKDAEAAMK
ncbi:MAG: peptidylprolyl isomerase [Bacteroidaceae bacterium]|nr:peptidylprolyl isomerase [Bacteroidaceae bacterium]